MLRTCTAYTTLALHRSSCTLEVIVRFDQRIYLVHIFCFRYEIHGVTQYPPGL